MTKEERTPVDSDRLKKCFVLSPIGDEGSSERTNADKALKHLVKKAISDQYEVLRADDDKNPGAITPRIVASILDADLIIADLTGQNANVFYELAIAHGYAKPTVHIQRVGERPAFDVKDMRIVRYDLTDPDSLEQAQKLLREYANFADTRPEQVETPLSAATRFVAVQTSNDPVAQSNVQVIDAINALDADVRRALSRLRRSSVQPSAEGGQTKADVTALKTIVERVVDDGRAELEDFEAVVNPSTSTGFDQWASRLLETITGESDEDILSSTLYDHAAFRQENPPALNSPSLTPDEALAALREKLAGR